MAFEDTDYPPVEQDEDWYRRMGMSPVGPGGTAPFMRGPAYDTPPVSTGGVPGERPPTTPSPRSARNYDVGEPRDINAPPVGAGAPPVAAAPRGLNLAEDAASGAAAPPVHSNYQAPPVSHGRRALAALAGGMAGYSDPARGYGIARDIVGKPEREADKRFGEDSAQFNEARQEGRQQAVERRQAATAESEIGLRGAQTALEQQKLQDLKDKPAPKEGDKMVHSGFNAQGQAAILWQRADGTTHVETYPDIVQQKAGAGEGTQPKADVLAQIGEEPKPGEKNSKGLTREQWGARSMKLEGQNSLEAAAARGEAYITARLQAPVQMLDTQNDNAPVTVTMQQNVDSPGRYIPASEGSKAMLNEASYGDIKTALNNLRQVSKVLDGGTLNRAAVASILAQPRTTTGAFLQSEVATQLSKEDRAYVVALLNAREVIPGIRGMLGTGQNTDERVQLMLGTLPSAKTPDSQMAGQQIDAIMQTLERAHRSVPKVPLRAATGDTGEQAKNYTDADVQAAAKQYKMTPAQIEDGFKKKGWSKAQ